ncbi:hypothetical protein [Micromonospora narathiwatensis]|uniref:Esterase n=1 Tax=Micromonospora narathiwatensis TaxID=299146 RepID=A0A1A8ZN66_9ACTN|nr:hypothetical protein [Micromonospora narathiwatensis]SBT45334.1 hypothetical protein GA0070621_2312 [Micromonospora narathiwatensis]
MSLTGLPLLLLVAATTVAAAVTTARTWRRHRRWSHLTRAAAVLLTETLALLTAGLAVNRTAAFYPTWADLLPADTVHRDTGPARPGHLDHFITSRAGRAPTAPITFTWHPPRWTSWPLTAAPTVVVPADYPQHPTWRYPVIVLTDPANPTQENTAAHTAENHAGPAVLVFTHLRPAATPDILTDAIPTSLTHDLRVTTHTWALVAGGQLTPLAQAAVRAAPTRYPTLALIDDTPDQHPNPAPTDLPPTETVAVAGVPTPPGAPATHLDAPPDDRLTAALTWACQQTPPPLSAPAPLIPPPTRHTHHGPRHTTTGG